MKAIVIPPGAAPVHTLWNSFTAGEVKLNSKLFSSSLLSSSNRRIKVRTRKASAVRFVGLFDNVVRLFVNDTILVLFA